MDPLLRMKVAQFLEDQQIFEKTSGIGDVLRGAGNKLKSLAMANRGKLGLIGGIGGTGAIAGGLSSLGQSEQAARQDAAELNQLIEAYPELLYETPMAPYQPEPDPMMYGGYAGQY